MKIRKIKQEEGITLIALIVTIIVILILSGISIKSAIGENGIISKVKKERNNIEGEIISSENKRNQLLEELKKEETNNSNSGSTSDEIIPILESQKFIDCYADIDNNGTIDGIIYADLAVGGSHQETDLNGAYTIPKVKTGLKKYYIKEKRKVDTRFDNTARDVIAPIANSGIDRFYVMALEDIDVNSHTWYKNASGKMNDYATYTSTAFGKGKENTRKMITAIDTAKYGTKDANDLWASEVVRTKENLGWFVPAKEEWSAFANELQISKNNYVNYKLSDYYWSSSQYATNYTAAPCWFKPRGSKYWTS